VIDNWERIAEFCLRAEGGYVSAAIAAKRGDAGGETKYGITKRDFPDEDVAALTLERARELYREQYFSSRGVQRACCDVLPWPLDLVHCDAVINIGNAKRADGGWSWTGNANKLLQRALGVGDDGSIGQVTLTAARHADATTYLRVIEQRRAYYQHLAIEAPKLAGNLKGWLARCDALEREAGRG
jgi:lysozyme family protein